MTLAIITESLRRDNHAPLRFFKRIDVTHFYWNAPYQDMAKEEFAGAVQYRGPFDLYRKLLAMRPDLIQGSEPYASKKSLLLSLVTLLVVRRLRIPFVFPTLENLPSRQRFGGILGPLVEWYFGYYAAKAKYIIALNNGAAANLRAVGIPDTKIVRFPWGIWGVDRTVFRPVKRTPSSVFRHSSTTAQSALSKVAGHPVILFVGRFDPEKGIHDLLHSFYILAHKYEDLNLCMIGRGMLEDDVQTFAKANKLTDRIHHIDWTASKDLPPYYSAARVTVYPSVTARRGGPSTIQGWSEQVGMVILQSLACGTPVVGTKSGAIPEYLREDVGLLVPEHNPELLAVAIERLVTDERFRDRLSQAGLRYIAEHFDAQKNVGKAEAMVLAWMKRPSPTTDYSLGTTAL